MGPSIKLSAPKDGIWGWVEPLADGLNHLDLDEVEIRAGRDDDECRMVFTNTTFLEKGMDLNVEKVSRVHFILSKDLQSSGGFLTSDPYFHEWNLGQ